MAYVDHRLSATSLSPRRVGRLITTRLDLWRSRRDLARLDSRALEDIGVTPDQARQEASMTIWDVPTGWKHK